MAYAPTDWVNNATPVDEAHLDKIEQGIVSVENQVLALAPLKVDKDSVVVAATRIVANKLLAGDAQPAFQIAGDGKHQWGAGGAAAFDTNLYRSSLGAYLETTNDLLGKASLQANHGGANRVVVGSNGAAVAPALAFGASLDTNLYRAAAGYLVSDGSIQAGNSLMADKNNTGAKLYFGSAGDTNLYRSAVNTLQTPGALNAGGAFGANSVTSAGNITANVSAAGQIMLNSNAGIYWGSAADTYLYRSAALQLVSNAALTVAGLQSNGQLTVAIPGTAVTYALMITQNYVPGSRIIESYLPDKGSIPWMVDIDGIMYFGNTQALALDTTLYRSAANQLTTGGAFKSGAHDVAGAMVATGMVRAGTSFGTNGQITLAALTGQIRLGDVTIQRNSAGEMTFTADNGVRIWFPFLAGGMGANPKVEYGAADSAGAGYRTLRILNNT